MNTIVRGTILSIGFLFVGISCLHTDEAEDEAETPLFESLVFDRNVANGGIVDDGTLLGARLTREISEDDTETVRMEADYGVRDLPLEDCEEYKRTGNDCYRTETTEPFVLTDEQVEEIDELFSDLAETYECGGPNDQHWDEIFYDILRADDDEYTRYCTRMTTGSGFEEFVAVVDYLASLIPDAS